MNIKEIEEQAKELEVYIDSVWEFFARQHGEKLVKQFCDRFDARFYSGMGGWAFSANDENHPRWTIPIWSDEEWYMDEDNYNDVSDLQLTDLEEFANYRSSVYSDDSIRDMIEILNIDLNGSSLGEYLDNYT